jgi:hypothetical protein
LVRIVISDNASELLLVSYESIMDNHDYLY